MQDAFFNISIKLNFSVMREYFLGRSGILSDLMWLLGGALLCTFGAALQLVWPSAVSELPFYPAVLVSGMLFMRRSTMSFIWPVLCGFLLDCGTYTMPGVSSLFLLLSSVVYWIVLVKCQKRMVAVLPVAFASAAATLTWTLLMLVFRAGTADFYIRLALFPREILLAPILAALCGIVFNFSPQNTQKYTKI